MDPAPAASPVPTAPIPPDGDRVEPVGTPFLRLLPPAGVPSVTTTGLDGLGAAADIQFGDSTARCSHTDWAREQQAEPSCYAAMRYIAQCRPEALLTEVLRVFLYASALSFRRFRSFLAKDDYKPPTVASACSYDSRLHPSRLTRRAR